LKIVFDTNVVLDVLLNREPYAGVAVSLFAAVERGTMQGFLCATTITTVDYLVAKAKDRRMAKQATQHLLHLFSIAEVNHSILQAAIASSFEDFEDAVLYEAGCYAAVDGFVTRNIKDFKKAERPVYSPNELWAIIQMAP
jgi:predicted nucleic acid-binding protein